MDLGKDKRRVPGLRIGGTSFLVPDEYIPAVRGCAPVLDDISLLLLEGGSVETPPITKSDIQELKHIGEGEHVSWNIHLPTTGDFWTSPTSLNFLDQLKRAVDLSLPLNPHTWVLHVNHPDEIHPSHRGADFQIPPLAWNDSQKDVVMNALRSLISLLPGPEYLALENLEGQPFDLLDGFVNELGCSRCFDIGHVWKDHVLPETLYELWLPQVRMCHLHGIGTRDHQSLSFMPEALIDAVLHPLWEMNYQGIITLEVFRWEDFTLSHQSMLTSYERYLQKH